MFLLHVCVSVESLPILNQMPCLSVSDIPNSHYSLFLDLHKNDQILNLVVVVNQRCIECLLNQFPGYRSCDEAISPSENAEKLYCKKVFGYSDLTFKGDYL